MLFAESGRPTGTACGNYAHDDGPRIGRPRACGLIGMPRSLYHYAAKRPDDKASKARLTALAAQKRRYGYRRRKRKRIAGAERQPKVIALAPNISWSMDFVSDGFVDGRRLRCLNIVDDFTKEYLAIEADTSLPGKRVVDVLQRLAEMRGLPTSVTVDNGPEFISKVLDEWAYRRQLKLRFIEPGKLQQNAYIESFNGKFRDECLNEHWFLSIRHARQVIAAWREEYIQEQPHSSFGYLTPSEFADKFLTADSMTVSY